MEFLKKHQKILTIAASCIVGLALLFYVIAYVDSCHFNSGLNTGNTEISNLQNQASNINANIANLNEQEAIKRTEINSLENGRIIIIREKEHAAKNTNQSNSNLANVVNGNFNGTRPDAAYRALCAAYPDAPDCLR